MPVGKIVYLGVMPCPCAVRSAKFVPRKQWVVAGADDMFVRVYNYNTMDKVKTFEAHTDYIRSVAVHPTLPYVLTSSDDMLIKLWDWDKGWACTQLFEGHSHYVMQVRRCRTYLRPLPVFSHGRQSVRSEKDPRGRQKADAPTRDGPAGKLQVSALPCSVRCLSRCLPCQVVFNPKDTNTFASASLDRTIKVSSLLCLMPLCT